MIGKVRTKRRASVGDVGVTGPDSGTTDATFTVGLSVAWPSPVTVRYATTKGTAVAPSNYGSRSGTIIFALGQTAKRSRATPGWRRTSSCS